MDQENKQEKEPCPRTSAPSLLSLNDTKAGMVGLDKEKIDSIIREASKDSAFHRRQLERQRVLDSHVQDMVRKMNSFTPQEIAAATEEMDVRAKSLEYRRWDLSRILVHLDMDMFFAAVEIRDNPSLADKPVAVGSNSMLSTSNYVARKFGVRAGMAGFIGKKLCPQLVILPSNFKKYSETSKLVMDIIAEYDPNYSSSSVDEASFDLTEHVKMKYTMEHDFDFHDLNSLPAPVWQMAFDVVNEIRGKIEEKTKLTASAGISHNRMFAKLCSDLNKPNGQYMLAATSVDVVEEFLYRTQVRKIPGIGPVQEQYLRGIGINTCRDLYDKRGLIHLLFSPASADFYLRVSLGISSNVVSEDKEPRKSLGAETTFKATSDVTFLEGVVKDLSNEVSRDLKRKGLIGRKVTLRIKWSSFVSFERGHSLPFATNDATFIFENAKKHLVAELKQKEDRNESRDIRLLGVRVSILSEDASKSESKGPDDDDSVTSAKRPLKQASIKDFISSPRKDTQEKPSTSRIRTVSPKTMQYFCIECIKEFVTESEFKTHTCHGNGHGNHFFKKTITKTFECPACPDSFSSLRELNIHLDSCLQ